MSLLQWPFVRKTYAGIENPVFVDDTKAANQGLMDAIAVVTGMNNTDFAILSGLDYVLGVQNTYTAGWFYFQGQIYYISTSFNELSYLQATPTDTLSEEFSDTASRDIYTINFAASTNTALGNTPQFSGNMNQYRIGLKYFQAAIIAAQNTIASLGSAAFLSSSTFALQTDFAALVANVLQLNNTGVYTPTSQYNPATKGYVDNRAGIVTVRLQGNHSQGSCLTDTLVTISLGTTLASASYMVVLTLISQTPTTPAPNDNDVVMAVRNKTTSSFDVWIGPPVTIMGPNNVGFDWMLFQ